MLSTLLVSLSVIKTTVDSTETPAPPAERRREPRFAIGAPVVLRLREGGKSFRATTVNVSTGGLRLQVPGGHPFQVGDEISCELAFPGTADQAFAKWGIGRVVRVDESGAAIELTAGTFVDSDGKPDFSG